MLSVIIGILFGIVPVTGAMGIVSYAATICALLHFYMTRFVSLDDNELFGPANYLVKCGLMPGFGMFMVRSTVSLSLTSSRLSSLDTNRYRGLLPFPSFLLNHRSMNSRSTFTFIIVIKEIDPDTTSNEIFNSIIRATIQHYNNISHTSHAYYL